MKAAVYKALKTIEFQDRPIPKAGPGEIVIKIKYCGICGTDMHIYYEGILPPGIVLGHENVGIVAEVGKGVEGWKVGDRVVAGPPGPCGKCYYCLHGKPAILTAVLCELLRPHFYVFGGAITCPQHFTFRTVLVSARIRGKLRDAP